MKKLIACMLTIFAAIPLILAVWGFAVLYADMMWFSGKWGVMTAQQESALWVINLLVLGFIFGERAVANLAPVISDMMSRRGGK